MKKILFVSVFTLFFGVFSTNAQEYWLNDDFSSTQWVADIQDWLETESLSLPAAGTATTSTAGFPVLNGYSIDGAVYRTADDVVASTTCAESSSVTHQYSFRLRNNGGGYIRLPKVDNAGSLEVHIRNGNESNAVGFDLQKNVEGTWTQIERKIGVGYGSYPAGEIDEVITFEINSTEPIELQLTGSDKFLNVFRIVLEKYSQGSGVPDTSTSGQSIDLYVNNRTAYITGNAEGAKFFLYDLSGRSVFETTVSGSEIALPSTITSGCYIVKVSSVDSIVSKKIAL